MIKKDYIDLLITKRGLFSKIGSLSNSVDKKQINFYMAPVGFPLVLFCYQ